MIGEVIFFGICLSIFLLLIIDIANENIKYRRFKRSLKPGDKLWLNFKDIGSEFDEGYTFILTIDKVGKKNIKAHYSDGSEVEKDILGLFIEGWKILDKQLYKKILQENENY